MYIDDNFKNILQKYVEIKIDNKTVKSGKFLLFTNKEFYYKFIFVNSKGIYKRFEYPTPFDYTITKDKIVFDYTIKTLAKSNDSLYYRLLLLIPQTSRIFNKQLIFHVSDTPH